MQYNACSSGDVSSYVIPVIKYIYCCTGGTAKEKIYLNMNHDLLRGPDQRHLPDINGGSLHETSVDDAVLYSNAESLYSTPSINFNPGDDNHCSLGIGATDDHYSHLEGMVVAQAAPSLYDRLNFAMIQLGLIPLFKVLVTPF